MTLIPSVSDKHFRPTEEEQQQLRSCYMSAMKMCMEKGFQTVAFPSLATRAHRYPMDDASKMEVRTLVEIMKSSDFEFERVVLCTQKESETELLKKALEDCLKELDQ